MRDQLPNVGITEALFRLGLPPKEWPRNKITELSVDLAVWSFYWVLGADGLESLTINTDSSRNSRSTVDKRSLFC
jgi:hypothetical protein